MMYTLKRTVTAVFVMLGLFAFVAQPVMAIDVLSEGCKAQPNSTICKQTGDGEAQTSNLVRKIISTLLFVIGVISVIMIIIGGIKYTTSNGDASKVTSAKNTILYAVVGLVIAMLAFAIVNFVVGQFTPPPATP